MKVEFQGIDKLVAAVSGVEALAGDPEVAGERSMERIRAEVTPGVPVVTGRLRRSGRVDGARLLWSDLHYAAPVERRRRFFEPVVEAVGPGIVEEELVTAFEEAIRG